MSDTSTAPAAAPATTVAVHPSWLQLAETIFTGLLGIFRAVSPEVAAAVPAAAPAIAAADGAATVAQALEPAVIDAVDEGEAIAKAV